MRRNTSRRKYYSRRVLGKRIKVPTNVKWIALMLLVGLIIVIPYRFSTLTLASSVWQMSVEFDGIQIETNNYFSQSELPAGAISHDWGQYKIEVNIDGKPNAIATNMPGQFNIIGKKPQVVYVLQDLEHVDAQGRKIADDEPSEPVEWDAEGGELKVYYYDFSVSIHTNALYNTTPTIVEENEAIYTAVYIKVRLEKSIFKNPVQAWYAGAEIIEANARLTDNTPISEAKAQRDWATTPFVQLDNQGGNLNAYKDEKNNTLVILKVGATIRAGFIEQRDYNPFKGFPVYVTVKNVEALYRIRLKIVTYTPPVTDPEDKQQMNGTQEINVTPVVDNPLADLYNAFGDLGGFFNSPGGMLFLVAAIVIFGVVGLLLIKK